MLIPVLVIANSSSLQRGLSALVVASGDFGVAGRATWGECFEGEFALILGELESGEDFSPPEAPIVLLSDRSMQKRALGQAFLVRDSKDETVWASMHAVLHGLSILDSHHMSRGEPTEVHDLTSRELELLVLLGEGLSNRRISEVLSISENTVKFHLSSVFSKLSVGSRTEAINVAIRSGLIML